MSIILTDEQKNRDNVWIGYYHPSASAAHRKIMAAIYQRGRYIWIAYSLDKKRIRKSLFYLQALKRTEKLHKEFKPSKKQGSHLITIFLNKNLWPKLC